MFLCQKEGEEFKSKIIIFKGAHADGEGDHSRLNYSFFNALFSLGRFAKKLSAPYITLSGFFILT